MERTRDSICGQIEAAFNAASYAGACRSDISAHIRPARGLALLHPAPYFDAVVSLETALSENGYYVREFEVPTLTARPLKAAALARMLRGDDAVPAPAPARTYCEVGFGAGHSALLALTTAPGSRVFSFDHGLARHTVPAHDFLDARFPDRLFLFLGDSAVTVPTLPAYYPGTTCDVVYLDGSYTYNATRTDLANLRALASPDHVVALAGGGAGTESLAAWADFEAEGGLLWEGTVLEAPDRPDADALVYGHFRPLPAAAAEQQVPATP